MSRSWTALAVSVLVGACGPSGQAPRHPDQGPVTIAVDGDPNGLFWDARERALLLADDDDNRVLRWTEAAGFSVLRELPGSAGDAGGLGQLVRLPDGSLVVARFGHDRGGDVVVLPPAGPAHSLAGLEPGRRRIGLAVAPDGSLYGTWFTKLGRDSRVGAVSELSLQGGEREIIGGLEKPVGVLATDEAVFVSDQRRGQILVAPRAQPAAVRVLAALPEPDLLAAGPDGSLYCGSATGGVYQVSASGQVRKLSAGFRQVRGVAYDAERRRLFVVDHDPDAADGIQHRLHILSVD